MHDVELRMDLAARDRVTAQLAENFNETLFATEDVINSFLAEERADIRLFFARGKVVRK